ncbi:MAG: chemotaxis protein CheW [Tissierellia bacterium]|nr:chemotaxis protein CheW [Tissierellia bacterium]
MSSAIDNKYVIFTLDKEYYGIPIDNVISIEKMLKATRIPNGPKYLKGVINLRGEVIPLIDLRQKLNMSLKEIDKNSRIIVVTNEDIVAGLIVDSSSEVIEIHEEDIDEVPSNENNNLSYIYGIGKTKDRLIILLELSKVLEN